MASAATQRSASGEENSGGIPTLAPLPCSSPLTCAANRFLRHQQEPLPEGAAKAAQLPACRGSAAPLRCTRAPEGLLAAGGSGGSPGFCPEVGDEEEEEDEMKAPLLPDAHPLGSELTSDHSRPCSRIPAAAGFSRDEAPASGLGSTRAPLGPAPAPTAGLPGPGAWGPSHTARPQPQGLAAQTPQPPSCTATSDLSLTHPTQKKQNAPNLQNPKLSSLIQLSSGFSRRWPSEGSEPSPAQLVCYSQASASRHMEISSLCPEVPCASPQLRGEPVQAESLRRHPRGQAEVIRTGKNLSPALSQEDLAALSQVCKCVTPADARNFGGRGKTG